MPTTHTAEQRDDDPGVMHDVGSRNQVATMASAMPPTPANTLRRAVFGSFIQCSEKMNSTVATR